MAKITVCKKSDFTVLDNGIFRDKRLSLKARGLLVTMLSLPEEWNYTVEGLSTILKEGQSCIKGVLNELEDSGYLVRKQTREENGYLGKMEYIVYEKPINKGFEPSVENPPADNPTAENPIQLNTKEIKYKSNKKYYSATPSHEYDFSLDIIKKAKETIKDSCLVDAVEYYLGKYRLEMCRNHPDISYASLSNFVQVVYEQFDGDIDCLLDGGLTDMINRHFETNYGKPIDYKFQHFATPGVILCQARNCGLIDGLVER